MSHQLMFEHAQDEPMLRLTREQCMKLLRNTRHGRLAFLNEDASNELDRDRIEIFPINYIVDDKYDRLVFRSAPGTKIAAAQGEGVYVAFETDGILSDQAWSVVVQGEARVLTDMDDIAHAAQLGVQPWVPTIKDYWAVISIDEISGRHFIFGRQPERGDEHQFHYTPTAEEGSEPSAGPKTVDPSRFLRDK